MAKGKLYLLPTTLGSESWQTVIPEEVKDIAVNLRFFAVENIKTVRRYLRKIDRSFPIDDSTFFILNKKTKPTDLPKIIDPLLKGEDMAILSEAGCPGVADPGSELVDLAHQKKIQVVPLVGPSSILLALMGSGFNGQSFAFNGYLPKDRKERIYKFKELEKLTQRTRQTQIFMETPFRNMNLLEDLLNELLDDTQLSIACDLTLPTEKIRTMSVSDWRSHAYDLNKRPCIFLLGKRGVS